MQHRRELRATACTQHMQARGVVHCRTSVTHTIQPKHEHELSNIEATGDPTQSLQGSAGCKHGTKSPIGQAPLRLLFYLTIGGGGGEGGQGGEGCRQGLSPGPSQSGKSSRAASSARREAEVVPGWPRGSPRALRVPRVGAGVGPHMFSKPACQHLPPDQTLPS